MSRKVGLLGAGYILDAHATALAGIREVELVAVCDAARSRAARAAARYGAPDVYGSLEELSRSNCDVVHVLLPPPLHLSAAQTLIDAGKSVFLEKPMGLDSRTCMQLAEQARAAGVLCGVNHNFLFSRSYEALRAAVRAGELGRLDRISAHWHFGLPLLQSGPFDAWPIAAPANLIFELGAHLAAFVIDLLGAPTVVHADASEALTLPSGQSIPRHWTALLRRETTSALLSLSVTAGHADRSLHVRGRAGSAVVDFGRDLMMRQGIAHDNPIFDAHAVAHTLGAQLHHQARSGRVRRLRAALAKRPEAQPFEESMARSIAAFYAAGEALDSRHDARFGAQVIRLCEQVASAAGVGAPSSEAPRASVARAAAAPRVLVVGGTGFIGRHLVRRLLEAGHSVRLLTRNAGAASLEFQGEPVELFAGSHGDATRVKQALEGIETVFHLAKCEGKRWADYVEGDIRPTQVLAEAALAAGVRRFIYTGTIASYASGDRRAVIDGKTGVDTHIRRRGHYARCKAACEALLQRLQRERGLPLVILRPGIVLGAGSPPAHPGVAHFVTETRVQYWGDGASKLPLVLVEDVADALVRAMQVPDIEGQAFLVTGPPLMSAREYISALAQHMRTRIEAQARPAWRYWLADTVKELAKNAVRHPNRRWPTLHDWRCNAHCARFDATRTEQVLGWRPVADRATLIERGIATPVQWLLR
ncbi:MAG TPA: NAD-dependent epimerase/dehydratase family protein [Steroidobacteraceae bacterium]|jgi:nucleoside-diphosphate-sugar epimerase/predicted dehydrogenase|nr:NAD-dependent epimerase/dehydratase family protein [Steroidobacteraceae bacterium]